MPLINDAKQCPRLTEVVDHEAVRKRPDAEEMALAATERDCGLRRCIVGNRSHADAALHGILSACGKFIHETGVVALLQFPVR